MANEIRAGAIRHLQTVLTAGALGSLPDGLLLERFLSGRGNADSSSAFSALVERHGAFVLGVCRDVLRNFHDAEDAAQATFLILARNGASIRRVDSLASWLFGVALRVSARAKAEAARRRAIERRGGEMKARSDDDRPASELPDLYANLDRLPERIRAPMILCHLEGLTNEQAAGELGLPVRTVQRRLAQGREQLRARMARRGMDPAIGLLESGFAAHAVPDAWLSATVRAAAGLAAGREIAAVTSVTVTNLTRDVLATMLIGRLKIAAAGLFGVGAVIVAFVAAGGAVASSRQAWPPTVRTDPGKAADPADAGVGPWIKGVVVDSSGQPVAGAQVSNMRSDRPRSATTKPDGTFVIAADDSNLRYFALLATADNRARQGIFRFHDPKTGTKGPRTLARIVLKPLRTVTVSVVDGRGAPVEGASVVVLDVVFPVAEGRTDARGIVTLSAPADVMTHWIFGYKAGVGFDYFENYLILPSSWSPLPERVGLVLNGARTVRVHAVDSANNPVTGVEILPLSVLKRGKLSSVNLGASAKVLTDAQGIATFDWLPADMQPRTNFLVGTRSYSGPIWPGLNPDAPASDLTLRLSKVTPISGKVTRPDGSPAAGILVTAEDFSMMPQVGPGRAPTAADGSYTIEVAPGRPYVVYLNDAEWAARNQHVVDVLEGKPRNGVDFRLESGSVIHGRVTAGDPPRPVPGISVHLIDEEPLPAQPLREGLVRIADTDQDGRYIFRVVRGNYVLTGPHEFGVNTAYVPLKVGDGRDIEKDFRVSRLSFPRRTLRGFIRSGRPDGPPIARAIVIGAPLEVRDALSHTFADGEGKFELTTPAGSALIYARDGAGTRGGFTLVRGAGDSEVTIVAGPAAIARGRVVDVSGKPYVNVRVQYSVSTAGADADRTAGAGLSLITDDLGRFIVPGLFVGARCKLYAVHPGGHGHSPQKSFEVKDAQPIDLGDVVLHPR